MTAWERGRLAHSEVWCYGIIEVRRTLAAAPIVAALRERRNHE